VSTTNNERLIALSRACHGSRPATREEYVDTLAARGREKFAPNFLNILRSLNPGKVLRQPFGGHVGSGKSTELIRIIEEINGDLNNGFYLVHIDAEEFLEPMDVTIEDVLLGLVSQLTIKAKQVGIELKDSYWEQKWQELSGMLTSKLSTEGVEAGFGPVKLRVRFQSIGKETRDKVRQIVNQGEESLTQNVHQLIVEFKNQLRSKTKNKNLELVLVFDSLERMRKYSGRDTGLDSIKALYVENARAFRDLNSHFIMTMPIDSARACYDSLLAAEYAQLVTMPSIKVTERDGVTPYPSGYEVFREMISLRTPEKDWEAYFEPEALDFIIKYSGGYARGFINAVQEACLHAMHHGNELPISMASARKAFRNYVTNSATAISPRRWEILAELEESADRTIHPEDPDVQILLNENHILEYINGEQTEGILGEDFPWYASNPVLKELPSFKSAQNRLRERVAKANTNVG
jgi:hypothetical protein